MDDYLKVSGHHVRERYIDPKTGKHKLGYRYRLTWIAAHGPLPKGELIHHLNGNESDDRIENLMAVTMKEHEKIHENFFKNKKTEASIRLGRLKGPGQRVKK